MEKHQDHRAIRICHPSASPSPIPPASSGHGREENHIHSWPGLRHELICRRRQTIVYL
ncbi:hypothetical protein PVAP13_1KG451015 [Panicum virgatum]|uniref:Uncharacterized protein n=1 Tax=Panicum virgatum TaxID=38727 RepID=A0A8T0XN75_PANVG|nr:hypothetical protein PVAP13_1KG451015 [Panicum virgatum]